MSTEKGHILTSSEVLRRWKAALPMITSPPTLWGWPIYESPNLPDNMVVVAPISVGNVHIHVGHAGFGVVGPVSDALLERVNESVIAFQDGIRWASLDERYTEDEEESMDDEDEVVNPWEIIEHDVGWEKTGIQIKIQHKKTGEIKMCRLTVEDIGWLHNLQSETEEGYNWKPRK